MFSEKDLQQISKKGLTVDTVNEQLSRFKKGFKPLKIEKPATINDGIKKFTDKEIDKFIGYYNDEILSKVAVKFVPASGAATRMFKNLFVFRNEWRKNKDINIDADTSFNSPYHFFKNIDHFAFYEELKNRLIEDGFNIKKLIDKKKYGIVLDYLLESKGLGYGNHPKAIIKFHSYDEISRTAIEEHLVEAAHYVCDETNIARIHFTVSDEHLNNIKALIDDMIDFYEDEFNIKYEITYSTQKQSTDTIAVDADNNPIKDSNDNLLFRPGGHGALIDNLNEIDADLIFIKNIDNVIPDKQKPVTYKYKKVIGGYLLYIQEKIFSYVTQLSDDKNFSNDDLKKILEFCEKRLSIKHPANITDYTTEDIVDYLLSKLDRPLRVCGMVKNEGEPGGGPFWVKNNDESIGLQIIEKNQINLSDDNQKQLFEKSTHFNPVDIVCSALGFDGQLFDLTDFIDKEAGFISQKSHNGKNMQALELPGLWNGAMADWNTIFAEVPQNTFNPVKTVNDLLRKEHQNK